MDEKISEKLPQEEVLKKIKEFYLKISNVNALYEEYLKSKLGSDNKLFEDAWGKLLNESQAYFQALSFADINWPHKKSIILEISIDIIVAGTPFLRQPLYGVPDNIAVRTKPGASLIENESECYYTDR